MRDSFEPAFLITVGLEGHLSDDPRDPGGFTVWGLSSRYNHGVTRDMTLEQVKEMYLQKYWIPADCDRQPFPMDICLFDSQVNPQNDPKLPWGGNQEIINMKPENWQEYCIFRMQRYERLSKPEYVKGHIFRVLNLCKQIKELQNGLQRST
jgi:hypothetical protein